MSMKNSDFFVNLSARAAWSGCAHLPEVVLHAEGEDVAVGNPEAAPDLHHLQVRREAGRGAAAEIGHKQPPRI